MRAQNARRVTLFGLAAAAIVSLCGQASAMSCDGYASIAVQDFQTMNNAPKCRIPQYGRWHGNYQVHYNWCKVATPEALVHEYGARKDHLKACGELHTL